ncbi:hypothetical protein RCOM_1329260 [Ricinus communis]|uniref:Uncharacterized protein n=1 Tax=Ricinus communis TaxID=3988 RepID=B9S6X6_RICCO|nr:hypothetical protein RCOM_1329260 [Ricinus communis]
MEDYLQYMKTLRSQMNDVEDQVAKVSVEEQSQIVTIQTLEADLNSAKSETKRLKEDIELMIQAKGQICSQILEKQRKIASLEFDSSTLSQTLELIQQERVSLSAKLVLKSEYYAKVADELNSKLQQQQVKDNDAEQAAETGGRSPIDSRLRMDNMVNKILPPMQTLKEELQCSNQSLEYQGDDARKKLMAKVDCAKAKLDEVGRMKSELATENSKVKQSIEQVRCSAKEFKPELLAMDTTTLEEEYKALLSDKAGEFEYLQSLQDQIDKLKGISHMIKCACGMEYKVEMDLCA